jgi:hypothetical protein
MQFTARINRTELSPGLGTATNQRPLVQSSFAKATEARSDGTDTLSATLAAARAFPAAEADMVVATPR